jgi:hypothetical protein
VGKRSHLRVSGEYRSGSHDNEEEVLRPMGHDRAKAVAQKAKGKAAKVVASRQEWGLVQ